jgi:hypothetical protein
MNANRIRFGPLVRAQIVAAPGPFYRAIVFDDPSMSWLCVCPPCLSAGMQTCGNNAVTLAQLDAWLGPGWSVRNG